MSPQIRDNFLTILERYLEAKSNNETRAQVRDTLKALRTAFEDLPIVNQRQNVKVVARMGIGRIADVPWIAFLDERVTQTTQKGIYCVFLFKADMSGVYLTLIQGVGFGAKTRPTKEDIERIHNRALEIRKRFLGLSQHGFLLDDDILLADKGAGKAYEKSTIAYKHYDRDRFPSEEEIAKDLDHVLAAYEEHIAESGAVFTLTQRQIEALLKYKGELDAEDLEYWHYEQMVKSQDIKKMLTERDFQNGKDLSMDELHTLGDLVEYGLGSPALKVRGQTSMFEVNDLSLLNERLRKLLYSKENLAERINDFLALKYVRLHTASQFLCKFNPEEYAFAARFMHDVFRRLSIDGDQLEKARSQAMKESGLEGQSYDKDTYRYFQYFVILREIKNVLELGDYLEVQNVLWQIRDRPPESSETSTPVVVPSASDLGFVHKELDLVIDELHFNPLLFEDEESLKAQLHAALVSGKHIMLVGPPGTGKTEIALSLCQLAEKKEYIRGYILTTATSDWTTFDTIGGYIPDKEGKHLEFMPGQFLRCFKETDEPTNKWLVIDEINRSDIDKAFGQLFTVLSGQSVELPFFQDTGSVKIIPYKSFKKPEISPNEYVIPNSWRLIATLNTYDKAALYQMSYAFMRRFAFINVNVPSSAFIDQNWAKYLGYWDIDCPDRLKPCFHVVKEVWESMNSRGSRRPLGPAIVKDILEFIAGYANSTKTVNESTIKQIITHAVSSFVVPQFEGLEQDSLDELKKLLKAHCDGEKIDSLFNEMFEG